MKQTILCGLCRTEFDQGYSNATLCLDCRTLTHRAEDASIPVPMRNLLTRIARAAGPLHALETLTGWTTSP